MFSDSFESTAVHSG